MNRIQSVIFYIVISLISVILIIAFIRLPSIIFIGLEDEVLSVLFYLLALLSIAYYSINIVDFFLVKLGIYGMIQIESEYINYRIKEIEKKQKEIENAIFKNKIKIEEIKQDN